jgi:hypothetical protein
MVVIVLKLLLPTSTTILLDLTLEADSSSIIPALLLTETTKLVLANIDVTFAESVAKIFRLECTKEADVTFDATTLPNVIEVIGVLAMRDVTAAFEDTKTRSSFPDTNAAALLELMLYPLHTPYCNWSPRIKMDNHISIAVFIINNSIPV